MKTTTSQLVRRAASLLCLAWAAGSLGTTPAARAEVSDSPSLRKQVSASVLARYDLDHDGVLNRAEKAAYLQDLKVKVEPVRKAALREFDWNRNGVLDADERAARQKARQAQHARAEARALARYDANRNGTLEADEQARRKSDREAWLLRKQAQMLEYNDANRNGVLDAEEKAAMQKRLEAGRTAALERYDANRDGRVDQAERNAAVEAEKARRSASGAGGPGSKADADALAEKPASAEGAATVSEVSVAPLAGARRTKGAEIAFTLGRSGKVSIRVYDTAGRLVRTVASNEAMSAGPHKVRWEGDGGGGQVANGLYVISVEAFGQRVTRKIPVVR